jgi:hypothetical protein
MAGLKEVLVVQAVQAVQAVPGVPVGMVVREVATHQPPRLMTAIPAVLAPTAIRAGLAGLASWAVKVMAG